MEHRTTGESYSVTAVRHFMHPLNTESVERVTGIGCASSGSLEDLIELSIRVSPTGIIEGIRCRTFGCVAAVACGSAFSEMVRGRPVDEALQVTPAQILHAVGGLPLRGACYAKLPILALEAAVENHRERADADGLRSTRQFCHRRTTVGLRVVWPEGDTANESRRSAV